MRAAFDGHETDPRSPSPKFPRNRQEGDVGDEALEEAEEARTDLPQAIRTRQADVWKVAEVSAQEGIVLENARESTTRANCRVCTQ